MKIFISYRFTGESVENINALLEPVQKALVSRGDEVYVNFYDDDLKPERLQGKFKAHDYIFHAFSKLNTQNAVLVLLNSDEKSEGMLLEVGYALAKGIPVVVAVKDGVSKTYLPTVGTEMFTWSDIEDLASKVGAFNFASLKPRTY